MSKPLLDFSAGEQSDDMRVIAPFVAAGDLSYVRALAFAMSSVSRKTDDATSLNPVDAEASMLTRHTQRKEDPL
jgi:hypothetical protein